MDQYIGRLLDNRYEILEVIGTGGMAVVYKARCHRLNRFVAIKILKDEYARDEEFRRRFHAEGEAVVMLSHPNIVQVYDVSSSDNANFIVMELIDGISLKQYMEKKGVLNWKETLHFAMQIGKGLEHAHSRGIVHRDIKPHNVMVLKNGSVKVMDFGIARVMSKSNTLTKEALGSVHYISPEQAKGGHTDSRSDIYSLSVVMYEMMTGRPPYDGESPVAVAIQHINGGAAMPSTLNPNIPGGLEQIIMKGMALEVQNRYVSATQMLQDMEEFRKNPVMLFDYRNVLDDSTRPITVVPPQPRTTAERVVQQKTGNRPSGNTGRVNPAPSDGSGAIRRRTTGTVSTTTGRSQRPYDMSETARRNNQRRREEERQRAEEERSRVATVAIVVCSAVAILAIVVFLVALFNGALLNREMEFVEVPNLIGKTYSDSLVYSLNDYKIHLLPQQYDSDYAEGQIMHQEPVGGSKVKKGADIWLTISMGPEPTVKVMSNFLGSDGNVAKSILEGQGFVVIPKMEASDEIKEGLVIRTEPEAGTELAEGQDVYIYISSGPDVTTALMLHVVGKDMEHAKELLDAKGFKNVRTIAVDSDAPAGTVVFQSEEAGLEIDVQTEIILEVSRGPKETEPEETQPEETEGPQETTEETLPMVRRNVTFDLPQMDVSYILSIYQDGAQVISGITIAPGTDSFAADFDGAGTVVFDIYVNGSYHSSVALEFVDG